MTFIRMEYKNTVIGHAQRPCMITRWVNLYPVETNNFFICTVCLN